MSKIRVATHSGPYHADDVFSLAALGILLDPEEIIIVRTRDQKIIEQADYVVDVGGEYDSLRKRFDHHQIEGAGERPNGIPYASFGLVWKEYGEKLAGSRSAAEYIDQKLVQAIDADDNGISIWEPKFSGIRPYTIQTALSAFRPTWKEKISNDDVFVGMVALAKKILMREIEIAQVFIEADSVVRHVYENSSNKQIISFEKDHPFGSGVIGSVLSEYKEPIYAIAYEPEADRWHILTVDAEEKFSMRKALPEEWRGKKDEELQKVTGVSDAMFCHRNGFLAVAKSKEGAVALAEKALAM